MSKWRKSHRVQALPLKSTAQLLVTSELQKTHRTWGEGADRRRKKRGGVGDKWKRETLDAVEEFQRIYGFDKQSCWVLCGFRAKQVKCFYSLWWNSSGQDQRAGFLPNTSKKHSTMCNIAVLCLCSRSGLYAVSLMLCLWCVFLPSGPHGTQRTTWPQRSTCKYLLFSSNKTQPGHTCRPHPAFWQDAKDELLCVRPAWTWHMHIVSLSVFIYEELDSYLLID